MLDDDEFLIKAGDRNYLIVVRGREVSLHMNPISHDGRVQDAVCVRLCAGWCVLMRDGVLNTHHSVHLIAIRRWTMTSS